jgi:hypothetical protein
MTPLAKSPKRSLHPEFCPPEFATIDQFTATILE